MKRARLVLSAVIMLGLEACEQRKPDSLRELRSPAGGVNVSVSGYQPRGTIDGYLTLSFSPNAKNVNPQLTFGHMLNVKLGWLSEHQFVVIYDILESRDFASPVYPTGLAQSAIEIVSCNRRYLDCRSLEARLRDKTSLAISQFPEGDWSKTERPL